MTDLAIKKQTEQWIKSVVVDLNFCPFAAKALLKNSIHYSVLSDVDLKTSLTELSNEFHSLDVNHNIETTFIIFKNNFTDFDSYLDLLYCGQKLIEQAGYYSIYQLASFHPEYRFKGSKKDDAANYTNRSLYPMLHILREDSIEKALAIYKNPELIPKHNIELAREKGLLYMQMLRAACLV